MVNMWYTFGSHVGRHVVAVWHTYGRHVVRQLVGNGYTFGGHSGRHYGPHLVAMLVDFW